MSKIKVNIVGDGVFGTFLSSLFEPFFELSDDANLVVLAVPYSAYDEVAEKYSDKILINVCSTQFDSTLDCLKHSERVLSIHPLFGKRTPADKRFSIITYNNVIGDEEVAGFLKAYEKISSKIAYMSTEEHDRLMVKTHFAFVYCVKLLKPAVEKAKDVPDYLIPNSFRKVRELVSQLDDMPQGTIESILHNPFAKEYELEYNEHIKAEAGVLLYE